jgi:hypothetical protein
MRIYQLDCEKFNGQFIVDDEDYILKIFPPFEKFVGQPIVNLKKWVSKKFGYCKLKEI